MAPRSPVDWEAVEREYRAGQLSTREIGRIHGVSHVAINKRAKADGWLRDLAEKVREEVSSKLVTSEVTTGNAREAIEAAAARGVEVVRSHRRDISAGRAALQALLEELKSATENIDDIRDEIVLETIKDRDTKRRSAMQRAVALPSRAGSMLSLSGAMKHLVALERQAFNLDAAADTKSDDPLRELMDLVNASSRPGPGC